MVDFNHQLIDECSQQGPDTRSHYGHPPPTAPGPAETGDAHSHTAESCVRDRNRQGATDVKTSAPQPMKYVKSRGPMSLAGLMA